MGERTWKKGKCPKVQVGLNGCTLFREHCAGAFKAKLELPMIHSPMPVRMSREKQNSKRNLPPKLHFSTSYKSKNLEASRVSIKR